eukprot:8449180-Pyramimonas_sp.AAC.1
MRAQVGPRLRSGRDAEHPRCARDARRLPELLARREWALTNPIAPSVALVMARERRCVRVATCAAAVT